MTTLQPIPLPANSQFSQSLTPNFLWWRARISCAKGRSTIQIKELMTSKNKQTNTKARFSEFGEWGVHKKRDYQDYKLQEINWEMWIEKRLGVKNRHHSWSKFLISEAIQMEYILIGHNKELCGSLTPAFNPQVTAWQNYKFQRNTDQKTNVKLQKEGSMWSYKSQICWIYNHWKKQHMEAKANKLLGDKKLLPFPFFSVIAHFLPAQF